MLDISGEEKEARGLYDPDFIYRLGEIVKPREKFCEDWTLECASGIHFFVTKEEAIEFTL